MYNIIYETSRQSRFDARYWMLGAGALGRPRGMVWGGRTEEGSGWGTHLYLWQIHFDIWQNQYNIVKLKKKSISSSALSLLHSPTPTSIHDHRKNHSLDQTDLCWQGNVFAFEYAIQVGHNFPSQEYASFNFMGAITICRDFGAQKNKV